MQKLIAQVEKPMKATTHRPLASSGADDEACAKSKSMKLDQRCKARTDPIKACWYFSDTEGAHHFFGYFERYLGPC
jgi:hypothetical protein